MRRLAPLRAKGASRSPKPDSEPRRADPKPATGLVVEDERDHQVHLVLDDLAFLTAHPVLFHPCTLDVPQGFPRARNPLLDRVFETLGRRRADLTDLRNSHRLFSPLPERLRVTVSPHVISERRPMPVSPAAHET